MCHVSLFVEEYNKEITFEKKSFDENDAKIFLNNEIYGKNFDLNVRKDVKYISMKQLPSSTSYYDEYKFRIICKSLSVVSSLK